MFNKPVRCMTDAELAHEHSLCEETIASRDRWGDDVSDAYSYRSAIETEQRGRRRLRRMAERVAVEPIVLDCPAPRAVAMPTITGTAKARTEQRPSQLFIVSAIGGLIVCLAVSVAFAGQSLNELDKRLAAMERV